MGVNLFAPILEKVSPAFVPNSAGNKFYFSVSELTNVDIYNDKIQVKICRQDTNAIVSWGGNTTNTTLPIAGPTSPKDIGVEGNKYFFKIDASIDLINKQWETNNILYKIQIRFIKDGEYSEWSTVLLVKPISNITEQMLYLQNAQIAIDGGIRENIEETVTPTFELYAKLDSIYERVNKYQFYLYDRDTNELIEASGWLQHNASAEDVIRHRFKTALQANEDNIEEKKFYYVDAAIITANGYEAKVKTKYYFQVMLQQNGSLDKLILEVEDSSSYCLENGCTRIKLIAKEPAEGEKNFSVLGTFVLSRTSEHSNFKVWEDLLYFSENYDGEQKYSKVIYTDFTIESDVAYKYALQQENSYGLRTQFLYEKNEPERKVSFDYCYLYSEGVQLKLKYNNKMSSFKYTTQANKQDTIGSKYPTIMRNGHAYYAEFPIAGMITLHSDEDEVFFQATEDGYFFQGERVLPPRMVLKEETNRTNCVVGEPPQNPIEIKEEKVKMSTSLTPDNFYKERIFREKVAEFLNNGRHKLYRSPQLGNKLVSLINVSFTPNETLGRMIFEFNSTAYEVGSCDLENLNKLGLIFIGSFEEPANGAFDDKSKSILQGQVRGWYPNGINLYDLIKKQVNIELNNAGEQSYAYSLQNLLALRISTYPNIDVTGDIIKIEAEISLWEGVQAAIEEEEGWPEKVPEGVLSTRPTKAEKIDLLKQQAEKALEELNVQLTQTKSLKEYLSRPVNVNPGFKLKGTGISEIYVGPNKIYTLDNENNLFKNGNWQNLTISSVSGDSIAFIVDYMCEATKIEVAEKTIAREYIDSYFGQLAGIFTDNKEILKSYHYDFKNITDKYNTYKMPWAYFDDGKKGYNDLFVNWPYKTPNVTFYTTLNLLDVIKEQSRRILAGRAKIYPTAKGKGEFASEEDIYYDFGEVSDSDKGQFMGYSENAGDNQQKYIFNYIDTHTLMIEADPGTQLILRGYEDDTEDTIMIGSTGKYILHPSANLITEVRFAKPTFAIVDYICHVEYYRMGMQAKDPQEQEGDSSDANI